MKDNNSNPLKRDHSVSFAKNVAMLGIAQIVVKILGLVYKIVIINVPGFGNVGNGYYSTGYQLYMVLLAISSIGIPNVVSKLVAERVAVNDHIGAERIFKVSFRLFSAIGLVLATGMFVFADAISISLYKADGVSYTLRALAPAVLFVSSNSVLRGYFTGLGSLKSTSISEIIEQFFNCVLSILFVYLAVGSSTAIMAAAGNLSTSVAALVSLGYMLSHLALRRKYIKIECKNQTVQAESLRTRTLVKNILLLAVPAAFASLVSTLSSNIDSITVNSYTGDVEAYGLMSKTETMTHLPLALGATLFIAMVPVISAKIKTGDVDGAKLNLSNTLFFSNIVMFPCTAGFIVLADPIMKLLFPAVSDGGYLLQLQSVAMLFAAVPFVLNGVFYGMGKQKYPAIILLLGAVLKLLLNILLMKVFPFGVVGAIAATIIYQGLVTIAEWVILQRFLPIKVPISKHIIKPAFASLIMSVAVYAVYKLLAGFGNTGATLVSIIIGGVVYFAVLLLARTFEEADFGVIPKGEKLGALLKKVGLIR